MKYIRLILLLILCISCSNISPLEGNYPSGNKNDKEQTDDPSKEETPPGEEGQEPEEPSTGTYKILFIGNSLTLDATHFLPDMLNAAGIRNIEMTRIFHGAYTLPLYNQNYSNDNICSIRKWKAGQARWSGDETLIYAPEDAVKADKYDLICIQEYSGNACAWNWNTEEKSAVNGLISKIKATQGEHKPKFVFLFSHTFGKGMDRLVANFGNDNTRQFSTCAETFSQMMQETEFEDVISTAAVIQNLRTTGLNKINACDMTRGDLTHLDYGMGRYAAGAIIFKKIITPLTGKRIEDNPFRLNEYYPHPTLFTTPVNSDNLPVIYAAVDAAVEKPFEITDLSSYSSVPVYVDQPGTTMYAQYEDAPDGCSFPVVFPIGNEVNDSYKQPYWSGYGLWVCKGQEQAFAKWVYASTDALPGMVPTRTWANDTKISSVALRGIWTGDYFEFVIPVEDFAAGTAVNFEAPFYTRQGPVFWTFEWLDGDQWKNNDSQVSSWDGKFKRKASFALKLGTTIVSQKAVFSKGISKGKLRFRIRCVDGTIQADTQSSSAVQRDAPNHTATDYSSVFYFHGGQAVRFTIGNN